ncbi:hypothetical protein KR032_004143, partial [Drosophila birchii]
MTSFACVCAAGLIHLMHSWALPTDQSKLPGPQFPTVLVAIALMDLIYDNRFIPQGFEGMSVVLQRIYEVAVALLLLELGIHAIWKPVERIIHLLTKIFVLGTGLVSKEVFWKHEGIFVGCLTFPLSFLIVAFVGQATDHFHLLRNQSFSVRTKVMINAEAALRYLRRNQRATGMPMPQYAETLQQYKETAVRRRRG